ncbi:MAG: DUF2121 domain-containing protein [Euryarchaeota archaeon]|nr:DUF2121 domain-containing protein [Euryarchaeota archaeon]
MSLILAYIGSRGCVIIGDKRRIGYFGDKNKREKLEEELYSGNMKTEEDLVKRAEQLGISIKIIDDAKKVRSIGDVVIGEVRIKTPLETKRRRIYGTTNGYNIVELLGSNIEKVQKGDSSIVVFGNKITKKIAKDIIKKQWKSPISLKDIAEIFKRVMAEVSKKTPSISTEYDIFIKHKQMDKKQAQKILDETIIRDVRLLQKWREKLREDIAKTRETIEMSSKIISEGEIGRVKSVDGDEIEVLLNKSTQAMDINWNVLNKPGEIVKMCADDPSSVFVGDLVVVENENLCIQRTKSPLKCDVILCRTD